MWWMCEDRKIDDINDIGLVKDLVEVDPAPGGISSVVPARRPSWESDKTKSPGEQEAGQTNASDA